MSSRHLEHTELRCPSCLTLLIAGNQREIVICPVCGYDPNHEPEAA